MQSTRTILKFLGICLEDQGTDTKYVHSLTVIFREASFKLNQSESSVLTFLSLFIYFSLGNSTSSKCFHNTENRIPCKPFANIFVSNPRNINPRIPLSSITFFTTCGYDNATSELCLYTLITRIELEHVSLTADEQNPMMARLPNSFSGSSCFGSFSDSKLYVKNHG